MASYQDLVTIIKSSSAQKLVKIEVLDENYQIIDTISPKLLSGSIDMSFSDGARRTANIVLDNSELDFFPDVDDLWMNNKFRISTGYVISGVDYYIPRGIFEYGENEISSSIDADTTASLSFYDQTSRLDGTLSGTLDVTYIIEEGWTIEYAVQDILTEAGETKTPIVYPTTETLPFDIVKLPGDTYLDILNNLASMLSWNFFYDSNGTPRFQPSTNIETSGSVWDFTTDEVNYLGGQRRYQFSDIKNYIRVIGDNYNALTYSAIAEDTNVDSPTRVALIGKRVKVIEDANIYSDSLASRCANYELEKSISLIEQINMSSIPVDVIETDNVITITDTALELSTERYLVKSLSFPLTTEGSQSLSLWRARSLS